MTIEPEKPDLSSSPQSRLPKNPLLSKNAAMVIAESIFSWLLLDDIDHIFYREELVKRGYGRDFLKINCLKHPEFGNAILETDNLEKHKIIKYAMKSELDHQFAKFYMEQHYGWTKANAGKGEKKDKKPSEFTDSELDNKIERLNGERKNKGTMANRP